VASRPERLEKDLENVKVLASLLEEQASQLRAYKPPTPTADKANGEVQQHDASESNGDAKMASPMEEDDTEPSERGSDAVERRIEKVMVDLKEQGLVDLDDEKAVHATKVASVNLVV